ncbi:ROK family protein [Blautia sp. HCP28S3_G10]|uniref:ROK family protein n=1 Tax=Blautia sp. HCP28S3_G10 TaxID=3438908 RepID=UPI003F8C19C1
MKKGIGKNLSTSKQYNRGLILQLIATNEATSRIELATTTMLTKMTITNIVSEYIEHGIVEQCEEKITEGSGRNPIRLRIAEKAPTVIGLYITRDKIEAVLCTLGLEILNRKVMPFITLKKEEVRQYSYHVIDQLLAETDLKVLGIGVAVMGPVDINNGIILNPPHFFGIENVNITQFLEERYGLPVVVDHDQNSAAQAEVLFGAGKNVQDFIFLGITKGIGSGFVSDGKVFHNKMGMASELGHISIDRNGKRCACGNRGCLEVYACVDAMEEKLRKVTGENHTFQEFCRMKKRRDVDKVLREMVDDIAVAIVSGINILHPQLVILGNECMDWDDKYVYLLEEKVNEEKFTQNYGRVPIRKAYFGKDSQLLGAAANVLYHMFSGKLPLF